MKNKLKLFGIIAAVALIGFSMVGCDNGNGNGGRCDEWGHCRFGRACYSSSCSVRQLISYVEDGGIKTDEEREAVRCNC